MQSLIIRGEIDLLSETNPIYVLNGKGRFYETEYKLMKNIPELITCNKGLINKNPELAYITDGLVPLSTILSSMNENRFIHIAYNIITAIKKINDNGFLNWQHIDLERIFIGKDSTDVHLIFLPIDGYNIPPRLMEKEVMEHISNLTQKTKDPSEKNLVEIRNIVFEGKTLDQLANFIQPLLKTTNIKAPNIIKLYDRKNNFTIMVNKPKFIIGKKKGSVDGVITYSAYISRVHCQILKQNNAYYIQDLNSTSGTLLNNVELEKNKNYKIENGDKIEIADIVFEVIF